MIIVKLFSNVQDNILEFPFFLSKAKNSKNLLQVN